MRPSFDGARHEREELQFHRESSRHVRDALTALCGLPPVMAVESSRTLPMARAVFAQAKIVHVLEGRALVETALGPHELRPGSALTLGAGVWCSLRPSPMVRTWTLYLDETFLRMQMSWFLPDKGRVRPGVHPYEWDGSPLVLEPGMMTLRRLEPLWRQLSIVSDRGVEPERAAARAVALFARAVELSLPVLLTPGHACETAEMPRRSPVAGRLSSSAATGHAAHAAQMLRTRMAEPWSVDRLASRVALSRSHLTRLFTARIGLAPMRFLTEVRLTEFTRLIEETDLPVTSAAREVGWNDSRVAAAWFRRRYGVSPSSFRLHPHPSNDDQVAVREQHR